MGFADLHIHSAYSYDGTASISAIMKYIGDKTPLSVIAITDHDTVRGVHEAQDLASKYGVEVIPGVEISSGQGHVLGLYIDQRVPAGLTLEETVLRVGELGGLCIAAHPMARGIHSLSFATIRDALKNPQVAKVLVGIEAYNGGLVYTRRNPIVAEECRKLPLAQTGNSDAHTLPMLGQGMTFFNGNSAVEFQTALLEHITLPHKRNHLSGAAVVTTYIPRILLRKLGWVDWAAGPDAAITYAPLSHALLSTAV
jgi:predicted metal-dependent phosphoesterase TrpH